MKTWNAFFLATAVIMLGFAIKTAPAQAFCVYNNIDKPIFVDAITLNPKGFNATIQPNNSACCNWKNGDCNKTKKQDSILDTKLNVKFPAANVQGCGIPRKDVFGRPEPTEPRIKMQGGGYLTVVNNPAYKGAFPKSYWDVKVDDSAYLVQSWTYDHQLLDTYTCPRLR